MRLLPQANAEGGAGLPAAVRGFLMDVDGVLVANQWPGAASAWAASLRISEQALWRRRSEETTPTFSSGDH